MTENQGVKREASLVSVNDYPGDKKKKTRCDKGISSVPMALANSALQRKRTQNDTNDISCATYTLLFLLN